MKLILKNNSSDTFSYVGGTISVSPGSVEISSKSWYALLSDISFVKDIRLANIVINDGIKDYGPEEAETYVNYLVDSSINRDSDGSTMQRLKITSAGWSLHYHGVEITTGKVGGFVDKDQNDQDFGYTTMHLYDASGNEITDQDTATAQCVKTVVDWEPTFDYDVIGGDVFMAAAPTTDIRVSVVGVPDIPAAYGGSKVFMTGFNLRYAGPQGVHLDGKTVKSTSYSATLHTNKMRIIMHHDVGVSHTIMVMFNIFKA